MTCAVELAARAGEGHCLSRTALDRVCVLGGIRSRLQTNSMKQHPDGIRDKTCDKYHQVAFCLPRRCRECKQCTSRCHGGHRALKSFSNQRRACPWPLADLSQRHIASSAILFIFDTISEVDAAYVERRCSQCGHVQIDVRELGARPIGCGSASVHHRVPPRTLLERWKQAGRHR